eukprot:gene9738-biopygen16740
MVPGTTRDTATTVLGGWRAGPVGAPRGLSPHSPNEVLGEQDTGAGVHGLVQFCLGEQDMPAPRPRHARATHAKL